MEKTLEAKAQIENGAKFNGIVYGKDNGKNWSFLFVYLNGSVFGLGSVAKSDANSKKSEYASILNNSTKCSTDFGTTYEKFGLDVAVGEAE